jgi:hypothetical protein
MRLPALGALALALSACQAVPDVTFVIDDASVDAGSDSGNTCIDGVVPPYATSCCGPIPCYGLYCAAGCDDCVARCTLGELCCPNAQARATCKANLQCP